VLIYCLAALLLYCHFLLFAALCLAASGRYDLPHHYSAQSCCRL
jgi:hypothetical protein